MVSSLQLAQSYIHILKQYPEKKEGEICEVFMTFLEESNLNHQIPHILRYLEYYAKKDDDFNTLLIESPFEIDAKISEAIRSFVGTPPNTPESFIKNTELIGGFRTQWKGTIVDASIQHTLQALKQKLTK